MKKIIIFFFLLFILPINTNADTTKYKWYTLEEKNIEYVEESNCNNKISKEDYKENILYEKEKDTSIYLNNNEVFFKNGTINKELNTNVINYIGINNITFTASYMQISELHIYNKNTSEEIGFNFVSCTNCDSSGTFSEFKTGLILYQNGKLLITLHKSLSYSDLEFKITFIDPNALTNMELTASYDRNNIVYYKNISDSNNLFTLDNFNVNKAYPVTSYIYYKKLYKCYEEEKKYLEGYYEYKEGYIKDSDDFIIEKEIKEENNIVKTVYPIEEIPKELLNLEDLAYLDEYVLYEDNKDTEDIKVINEDKIINNKDKKIKQEKQNKINIFYLILTIILILGVFLINYFIKRCRVK